MNSDIAEQIEIWKQKNDKLNLIDNWDGVICSTIILIACLYMLLVVLFVHKRKEWFLITTTVLFTLYAALGLPVYYRST